MGKMAACFGLVPTVIVASLPATAVDLRALRFAAEATAEIENEYIFGADDPDIELNDMAATVDLDAAFVDPGGSGFRTTLVFEPVRDPQGDRFLRDMGFFVEEAYFDLRFSRFILRAGKLEPLFGLLAEAEPGLYGDDLAGEYDLAERIGFEVDVPVIAWGGEHVLTASTFVADRTILSDSAFTSRDRVRLDQGGVSNTEVPRSFVLSGTGQVGPYGYMSAIRYQSAGEGDEADDYGAVLGLSRKTALAGHDMTLLAELAHFPKFDGESDRATFATLGAEAEIGRTLLSLHTGRAEGRAAPIDRLATATLEIGLTSRVSLGAGYRYLREENEDSHTIGARLTVEFGPDRADPDD